MTTSERKWVYAFENGDGHNKMLLGGKGANLCEMTRIGLNVPPGFVITTDDRNAALAEAAADARAGGGITAFLYSTDEQYAERAIAAYSAAGAQLTCNLTGPMPLNFAAAYSDYHVTGLNPAGNATLTDLAFVASRFRITQSRAPAT